MSQTVTRTRPGSLWSALRLNWKRLPLPWRKAWFIGLDVRGNEYYEQKQPTFPGRPVRRWVQPAMKTMDLFEETHIPVQWQSWLRHRRPQPPTEEDIQADEAYRLRTVARAMKLDQQWQEPRKVPLASSTQDTPKEKAKPVKKLAPSVHYPTGQGETFTPGAWTPGNVTEKREK
ncbi:hypothetical protein BJ684DRAFT_12570 [Piptocephalis cylindrospora]|uniref:NADH dehydrogenase [ubiquinone] 1 alpha subcomplex subunit n=1 Tax=Piptocephalis cylindrospora TaxID=1907219 RepID=A0A4P9Y1L5_9FUNG|nr:hypothetical protein BJ684DRAFT_12570 [Piptocephalis cylindrospora]|eukprot:RKP11710.1 hypothetical protein BJ684DRAFT_12570 [Piptocephalis cylindrospora]